jgi:hypothetical protein
MGISDKPLALIAGVAPIVSCFEGQLSTLEIAEKFAAYGVRQKMVEDLAQILDQHLFLATPAFFEAERKMREEFGASPVRPAALAGSGYAEFPESLALEIDGYLQRFQQSGADEKVAQSSLIGLIAPHIDYARGQICYGITYNYLRHQDHDLYIIMGTAHQYSRLMFHLTLKDFACPLGPAPCDREFVESLANMYGYQKSFADEILHRREHSLEYQIPFLTRLKRLPKIVPILVGGFHHMLNSGQSPADFDEYESFAAALSTCLSQRLAQGMRICFIAGVDMAHAGRHFGDSGALNPEILRRIAERDQIYLDCIMKHDAAGLFQHVAEDSDARKICGFPTMYTLLDVLKRLKIRYEAKLFDYRQAVEYSNDCAVSFAGVGLYQAPKP